MDRYEEMQQPLFDIIEDPPHNGSVANVFVDKVRRGCTSVGDICFAVYREMGYRVTSSYCNPWHESLYNACIDDGDGGRAAMEGMARWALEWEQLSKGEKDELRRERAQPHVQRYYASKKKIDGWGAARAFLPEERQ